MRHRGPCPWGIRIGPFAVCLADFFPKKIQFLYLSCWEVQFLITPEREREDGERESLKSEWDTGVFDIGAFKFDHLQPVKLILFLKFSIFFYFSYCEVPFIITPERGRKERTGPGNGEMGITQKWIRQRGSCLWGIQIRPFAVCLADFVQNIFKLFTFQWEVQFRERKGGWGKGNHSKVNETQGFLTWGHSNLTICCLLSWFCS